jgi:hypothetical protein
LRLRSAPKTPEPYRTEAWATGITGLIVAGAMMMISLLQCIFGQTSFVKRMDRPLVLTRLLFVFAWFSTWRSLAFRPWFEGFWFEGFWFEGFWFEGFWFEGFILVFAFVLSAARTWTRPYDKSDIVTQPPEASVTYISALEAIRSAQHGPSEAHREDQPTRFLYGPRRLIPSGTSLPHSPRERQEMLMFHSFVRCTCRISLSDIPQEKACDNNASFEPSSNRMLKEIANSASERQNFLSLPPAGPARKFFERYSTQLSQHLQQMRDSMCLFFTAQS